MDLNALKADVARGRVPGLLCLYGDNMRAMEMMVDACSDQLFSGTDHQLNRNLFDAQIHRAPEIVQAARTVPFAAARRLVVVRRADAFTDDDWSEIEKYCARPSPACCLVLVSQKSPLKGALLKLFQQHGSPVACSNPRRPQEIKAAIRQELSRHGLSAGDQAQSMIAETVGGDALKLEGEIRKLALYCRGKKKVDPEDVAAVLSTGHISTIFNLVEGIGSGRVEDSLRILGRLSDDGMHALQIIKMILRQFRLIAGAHEGLRRGLPAPRIAQDMGVKEWQAGPVVRQAQGWTAESLARAFEELYETQAALKRSRVDGRFLLDVLLCRLAALRGQRPV